MQSSASTTKISSGKSVSGRVARTIPIVSGAEIADRGPDREQVARGREPPDPPVDAEEDEEDVADAEQDRQRREEDPALDVRAAAVDEEEVGGEERDADDREVGEHLDEAAGIGEERTPERRRRAGIVAARALLQVGEEARELDEDDERDQQPDRGHAGVCEHVVGERGRAEQRRQQRQRGDRLLLGEAVVDEPVRGVVGAALGDGPALERPPDGHERRVEDRDREHEQRQHDARQRRAGGRPARRERERGEAEAEHLAAGVAHEDAGAAARPEVEGEEAEAGATERERDDERELARRPGRARRPRRRRRRPRRATRRGRPCCRAG